MTIKLGAHVSIAGGYDKALKKINDMGGNCLQIFSTSPRGWNFAKTTDQETKKFKELRSNLGIDPIYFHASYLVNLADGSQTGHLSKLSLIAELETASKLGIKGSIIHLGSYKTNKTDGKYTTLIRHIKETLAQTPPDTLFIIENAGNNKIGQTLEEIGKILIDVNNDRVKVCLDTCHLFSTNHDLRTKEKLDVFLILFDQKIGLDRLEVWHLNDSRDPLGSFRDRHENIGKGTIGLEEFKLILNHPKLKNLPFIIEVPGFDDKGPDKANLEILKALI